MIHKYFNLKFVCFRNFLVSVLVLIWSSVISQNTPENPIPDKCYFKTAVEDELVEIADTIVIRPSFRKLIAVAATYKYIDVEVIVKDSLKKSPLSPVTYDTVDVNISCEEANQLSKPFDSKNIVYVNYNIIPAKFKNDTIQIELSPMLRRSGLKLKIDCSSTNIDDCFVPCQQDCLGTKLSMPIFTLVSESAVEELPLPCYGLSYKKQVLKSPLSEVEVDMPAEYAIVKRKVIDQPARVIEEIIPAQTKIVWRKIVSKSIASDSIRSKDRIVKWQEIDCKTSDSGILLSLNYELNSMLLTVDLKSWIDSELSSPMTNMQEMKLEINAHTDSRGDDNYNLLLSLQRAQAVVDYLASKGISKSRLVAKGFGESKLKNNCSNGVDCSEEQHQENRRTEFRIIR